MLAALLVAPLAPRAGAQTPPQDLLLPPAVGAMSNIRVVTGDANGDGQVDLLYVRAIFGNDPLAVRLGDGLGGFGPELTTDIGAVQTFRLCPGDFNEDGRTDLAFLVFSDSLIMVSYGQSDGPLSSPISLPLAHVGIGLGLTLCDLNEDGHLDLLASQDDTTRLTYYAGIGDGSFVSPPAEIPCGATTSLLISGDYDGDGHIDVAFGGAAFGTQSSVMFGHGDGSFDPPSAAQGQILGSTVAGDLTGDGRDDLAPLLISSQEWALSWQSGQGFVATHIETEIDDGLQHGATIGDHDGDGSSELLLVYSNQVHVFGPGPGGDLVVSKRFPGGSFATDLQLADIDQDGGVDVLVHGHAVDVLAGQGDGDLQPEQLLPLVPLDTAVGDVTGDGVPDVVTVFGAGQPAQLLRGRLGGGLEQPEPLDVGPEPTQVWVLDATGDGRLDVVAAGGTSVIVVAGVGDGSFEPPLLSDVPGPIDRAVPAPFGGDALVDLAVLTRPGQFVGPSSVHLLINAGGHFGLVQSMTVTPPGTYAYSFEAADLDGDGDTDLISHWAAGYLRVFLQQPSGFEPAALIQQYGEDPFLLADLDGDGDLDLALHTGGPDIDLLWNDGAGDFPSTTTLLAALSMNDLDAADLDADGRLDLVATGDSNGGDYRDIAVSLGQPGGFVSFGYWALGGGGNRTNVADMNGDGLLDLVVGMGANPGQGALTIVENGHGPWSKRGHSLAGAVGFSRLQGFGPLTPGSPVTLRVSNGQPVSMAFLIAGPAEILAPFKGGVLVPQPALVVPLGLLDAMGSKQVTGSWPASMPAGAGFSMQVWRPEVGAPSGFGATTAIRGTAP